MCTPTQPEQDLFQILLYRKGATELLLESTPDDFRLPVLAIPKHTRPAEELTRATENRWGVKAYCLFTSPLQDPSDLIRYRAILEACEPYDQSPNGMEWHSVADRATHFAMPQATSFDNATAPFARPGWLKTVTDWVRENAVAAGLTFTGNFAQLNASPTFSLLRFETNGPALWFKAVGEPNVREFSITRKLAAHVPDFMPRVIAWRPDWNAWLSVEAEGVHLTDTTPLSAWRQAAARLADLQLASYGHGLHFIDAGCRDIQACSLLPLVDPFFECIAQLMELQTKPDPPRLSRAELLALAADIRCCLSESIGGEIPNTLGHLDFNPGNILVSPKLCVFLDWAEGSVGHPFFTFQYLLEHWRRIHGAESKSERALASSYASAWQAFASPDEIAKHFALMPMLAAFAYAASLSWRNSEALDRPVVAGHFRSLTRRMKREADALRERSLTCVL